MWRQERKRKERERERDSYSPRRHLFPPPSSDQAAICLQKRFSHHDTAESLLSRGAPYMPHFQFGPCDKEMKTRKCEEGRMNTHGKAHRTGPYSSRTSEEHTGVIKWRRRENSGVPKRTSGTVGKGAGDLTNHRVTNVGHIIAHYNTTTTKNRKGKIS